MKRTLTIILATLIGFGFTVSISADKDHKKQCKHKHGKMLKKMDTNGDKQISSAEWTAHFNKMDANKDGQLTKAEMKAHHKKHKKMKH